MNWVIVRAGGMEVSFEADMNPWSEQELLQYKAYIDFIRMVGFGALAVAEVASSGVGGVTRYSFDFTVRGNSIDMDKVLEILRPYKDCSECLDMHIDQEKGTFNQVLAFDSYAKSHGLHRELEGYMNIGVNHDRDKITGKYLVVLQVYLV